MEFRFFCPACGQKMKADVEYAGKKADCIHCGVEFTIPQPEKNTPEPASAPAPKPASTAPAPAPAPAPKPATSPAPAPASKPAPAPTARVPAPAPAPAPAPKSTPPPTATPAPAPASKPAPIRISVSAPAPAPPPAPAPAPTPAPAPAPAPVAAPSQPVGTKGELACPLCWLRFDKGEVIHLEAKSPTSDLACPHCRHKLPPDFLRVPYHTISLIGDQDAGKSSFLCMLTKVLPVAL